MSCISGAQTVCEVIYHVYRNKSLYSSAVKSIRRSRDYHNEGKQYCYSFRNPSTGVITLLTGQRILEILGHPNVLQYCNDAERCVGLVLLNARFFAGILEAFNQALQAKDKDLLFCKGVTIPSSLFPNVPSNLLRSSVAGKDFIKIMYLAIGGVPLSQGGLT